MGDKNVLRDSEKELRLTELIGELHQVYEEERNGKSQIIGTITAAATVLGLLLGSSFIIRDKGITIVSQTASQPLILQKFMQYLTVERVVFWLGNSVFVASFAYLMIQGMLANMRHYYMQDIQDRILQYTNKIYDEEDNKLRGQLLHYHEYLTPIITLNPTHIKSGHTLLNFLLSGVCVVSCTLFSISMVGIMYLQIEKKARIDYVVLIITSVVILSAFYLYARFAVAGYNASKFAWDLGHMNQELRYFRKFEDLYQGKFGKFNRRLKYYLFPNSKDWHKILMVPLGFVAGIFLFSSKIDSILLSDLVAIICLFEFVAYQGRYQINDLRGIEEDQESEDGSPLIFKGMADENTTIYNIRGTCQAVAVRAAVLMVTLVLGFLFRWRLRWVYLISIILLIISTIAYESVRSKKLKWGVYLLVGTGYPLRILVGMLIVNPGLFGHFSDSSSQYPVEFFFSILLSLFFYGSMASTMSWALEVSNLMHNDKKKEGEFRKEYKKAHFLSIQNTLKDRYKAEFVKKESINLIHDSNKISDPWTVLFLLSVISLAIYEFRLFYRFEVLILIICIIMEFIGIFCPFYIMTIWEALSVYGIGLYYFFLYLNDPGAWVILCAHIFVVGTYIALRMGIKHINVRDVFKRLFVVIGSCIIGKYALKILIQWKATKPKAE